MQLSLTRLPAGEVDIRGADSNGTYPFCCCVQRNPCLYFALLGKVEGYDPSKGKRQWLLGGALFSHSIYFLNSENPAPLAGRGPAAPISLRFALWKGTKVDQTANF